LNLIKGSERGSEIIIIKEWPRWLPSKMASCYSRFSAFVVWKKKIKCIRYLREGG